MILREDDIEHLKNWYGTRYQEHGISPKSLGWDKGKQNVRFDVLTSQYDFSGKSVLDIGCGFGELTRTLDQKAEGYAYTGIDLMEPFVRDARRLHEGEDAQFVCGDFLTHPFERRFDYCVSSGVFNHKLDIDGYEFIRQCIERGLSLAKDGLAFDFLSDRVDYPLEHTFHSNPMKVLEIAYSFSRNVVLRNDYMPFEFSLFVFKDDSFEKSDTLFSRYKKQR